MKKLLILAVSVIICTLLFVSASAATFINPVTSGADPYILKDGDTYYLYVTGGDAYGYRVFSSKNLVEWEGHGYCLLNSDVYTDENSQYNSYYLFWAPEVIKYEGKYYMVISAQHRISIAVSDSPLGPFKNDTTKNSFIFGNDSNTIDGHFFEDNGKMYLFFVTEGKASYNGYSVTKGNNIWGCKFDMKTLTPDESSIKLLLKNKDGDEGVVEGPSVLKNNNTYYLTFSSGGYANPDYAVQYVTASSPLGDYSSTRTTVLECDDLNYTDNQNDHLYGTAHHTFTRDANGGLVIVYHAHRTGWSLGQTYDENGNLTDTAPAYVSPRTVCIDKAGFDANGVLWAGSVKKGVPTAGPQEYIVGAPERQTHYEGTVFEGIENLPTVYVAFVDGRDDQTGATRRTPVKTIERAAELLKNTGGTIALIQDYNTTPHSNYERYGTHIDIPKVNGPLLIASEPDRDNDVLFSYKLLSVNSPVYFDNLIFVPEMKDNNSIIECNFNTVTFGEGVSCISRPANSKFMYIVGGNWWYTGGYTLEVYDAFRYNDAKEVTSKNKYAITVYNGSFEGIFAGSMKSSGAAVVEVEGSAPNATLTVADDVNAFRPGKSTAPTLVSSAAGTIVKYDELAGAKQYQISRNGEVIGYSDTTTFVDGSRVLGATDTYTVRGYINGCYMGAESPATTITTYGDIDGDSDIDLQDALALIGKMLNKETKAKLTDLLAIIGAITK